jgi:hypothetical protein
LTVRLGTQSFDITALAHIPNDNPPEKWPPVNGAGLPSQQVAILYLSQEPRKPVGFFTPCPSRSAVDGRTAVAPGPNSETVGRGTAFQITSDVPISAYDIYPFGGAASFIASGSLLMPTTAWGTNYVAAVPPKGTASIDFGPILQVVGAADGTTLKILPTVSLPGGAGVAAAPANTVSTYTLNAGEYIEWHPAAGTVGEVSGTIVSADKPVALMGGLDRLLLVSKSTSGSAADQEQEQIPPVSALGSTYVAAPFVTRRKSLAPESLPHRVVGLVNATSLTYDPPVPGAPASVSLGEVVDFESSTPFVVTSQDVAHPFFLALITPGGTFPDGTVAGNDPAKYDTNYLGDPEFDTFLPPAQFLPHYVFFTDPTYATTTLTVVRVKTNNAFADVTVDCVGTVSDWKPIDAAGKYQLAYLDLKRAMKPVGNCADGPHIASSPVPFGLTVRGWDRCVSYGYAAGGNAATINAVVVPPVPR